MSSSSTSGTFDGSWAPTWPTISVPERTCRRRMMPRSTGWFTPLAWAGSSHAGRSAGCIIATNDAPPDPGGHGPLSVRYGRRLA